MNSSERDDDERKGRVCRDSNNAYVLIVYSTCDLASQSPQFVRGRGSQKPATHQALYTYIYIYINIVILLRTYVR